MKRKKVTKRLVSKFKEGKKRLEEVKRFKKKKEKKNSTGFP